MRVKLKTKRRRKRPKWAYRDPRLEPTPVEFYCEAAGVSKASLARAAGLRRQALCYAEDRGCFSDRTKAALWMASDGAISPLDLFWYGALRKARLQAHARLEELARERFSA